jgi:hypothetical protein
VGVSVRLPVALAQAEAEGWLAEAVAEPVRHRLGVGLARAGVGVPRSGLAVPVAEPVTLPALAVYEALGVAEAEALCVAELETLPDSVPEGV